MNNEGIRIAEGRPELWRRLLPAGFLFAIWLPLGLGFIRGPSFSGYTMMQLAFGGFIAVGVALIYPCLALMANRRVVRHRGDQLICRNEPMPLAFLSGETCLAAHDIEATITEDFYYHDRKGIRHKAHRLVVIRPNDEREVLLESHSRKELRDIEADLQSWLERRT